MIQDLVIKLDENKQPLGNEVQSPPLLYTNIKRVLSNVVLSDERAIPEELEPHNYGVFEWAWAPNVLYTQTAESAGLVKQEDGIFRPTFTIRPATENEISERVSIEKDKAEEVIARKLKNSYYLEFETQSGVSSDKWEEYRTQLKDVRNQLNYPFDIVWPINPTDKE
jgi:hypothetical protein